jgi:hypothetical protein
MSEAGVIPLDGDLNVGTDSGMRALAYRYRSPRNHDVCLLRENAAAPRPAALRSTAARALRTRRSPVPHREAAPAFAELPAATDAWWLSRSQAATFARRRIALPDACARRLGAIVGPSGQIVVEFNGASFVGATVTANDGRYELELGDALAQEMAEVLDDDDGIAIDLVARPGQPTLAIQPYVGAAR